MNYHRMLFYGKVFFCKGTLHFLYCTVRFKNVTVSFVNDTMRFDGVIAHIIVCSIIINFAARILTVAP